VVDFGSPGLQDMALEISNRVKIVYKGLCPERELRSKRHPGNLYSTSFIHIQYQPYEKINSNEIESFVNFHNKG